MSPNRFLRASASRSNFVMLGLVLFLGPVSLFAQEAPPAPTVPPPPPGVHQPRLDDANATHPFDPRAEFGSIEGIRTEITTTATFVPEDLSKPFLAERGHFVEPPRPLHPFPFPTPYGWIDRVCYQPLYFEQRGMERFGESRGCLADSLVSAGRFYATIPTLPYRMTVHRPCAVECPCCGISSECLLHKKPAEFDHAGIAVEAATIAGLILLVP